jgi:hypothetical protein
MYFGSESGNISINAIVLKSHSPALGLSRKLNIFPLDRQILNFQVIIGVRPFTTWRVK